MPTSKTRKTIVGDVLVRRLPDGRFGAMRVLKVEGRSTTVSTTRFLSDMPPQPDDPALREPLIQNRFAFGGRPDVVTLSGTLPPELAFAFNVPLTPQETAIECRTFGNWGPDRGMGAYLEWRWVHDRPAFEAEVAAERARVAAEAARAALAQRPGRMLAESRFWKLIALLDWTKSGDDDAVLAPLVDALAALSKADIRGFEERLAYCLYRLDTREHAKHIGDESWVDDATHFSADWFLYVRCCAVANGRAFYEAALADPSRMPRDLEFESLLGVAADAWEARTGDDFDHDTGCSAETFSNVEGWQGAA